MSPNPIAVARSPKSLPLDERSQYLRRLIVDALVGGLPVAFDDAREQIVYEMAMVLSQGRWVPRGLHDRAVKALGHVGITDVITLMGHYTSVAMTLAFYDVPAGATGMAR